MTKNINHCLHHCTMVKIITVLIVVLTACSGKVNKHPAAVSDNKDAAPGLQMAGMPEEVNGSSDSARFHIVRSNYASGARHTQYYQDTITRLDSCIEFYENGKLKETGVMTNGGHVYIGTWKYYSPAGTTDSVVDYDKKYPVTYSEALQIAGKKGYRMPDLEVSLKTEKGRDYWHMARWTKHANGAEADVILISTQNGKVTRPDYITAAIY